MSKTPAADLITACNDRLASYLRSGQLNGDVFAESLEADEERFDDFPTIKQIHFALTPHVAGFLRVLDERLRRIKTTTDRELTVSRGSVDGRIDWEQTYKRRYEEGNDHSLYAIARQEPEYDIPENLVLKQLLATLQRIAREDLRDVDDAILETSPWFQVGDEQTPFDHLEQLLARNVHLKRIADASDIRITERVLTRAAQSRDRLYRDAHDLYTTYEDLMADRFSPAEMASLLHRTLVVPGKTHRLFEIFAVTELTELLRGSFPQLAFQSYHAEADVFARARTGDVRLDVYHDQTGPFRFYERVDKQPEYDETAGDAGFADTFLQREARAADTYDDVFGDEDGTVLPLYSGQPDILVPIRRAETTNTESAPEQVLIGEVKYKRGDGVRAGLKDLMRYLHHAYHPATDSYLRSTTDVVGIVVTDDAGPSDAPIDDDSIFHVTTSDLRSVDSDAGLTRQCKRVRDRLNQALSGQSR